jgi:hypothetical protein
MEESIIISTYRAMLTNLRNGWTSLEDMEKLKNKCLDKEQYEQCESNFLINGVLNNNYH